MVFESDRQALRDWNALHPKRGAASLRDFLLSGFVVVSLSAGGFLLPGMLLDPGLKGYVSDTSVKISNSRSGTQGVQRMAAQLRETLLSPVALGLMVSDMKLKAEDVTGVETSGHLSVLLDLLAGGGQDGSVVVGAAETALKDAVTITSKPASDEIDIRVTAATPQASQRIADYLASRVVRDIGAERHDPQLQAVETARLALDSAEAALTGFQMRHGNDAVSRIQDLQQKIREDDAETEALVSRNTQLADAIASAASMKLDDVLSQTLPAMPAFAALEDIRQNYTAAKLAMAEVSVDHGPKHPRTIAAQTTLDAARSAAMPALRRVREALASEQAKIAAALSRQQTARAELDRQMQEMGDAPANLARLETALEEARSTYIRSSDAAGTFSPAPRPSAAIAQVAQPGLANYDSFTAKSMALAGGAAGLLMSLLALSFRRKRDDESEQVALPDAVEAEVAETPEEVELVAAEAIEIEPGIFDDVMIARDDQESVPEAPVAAHGDAEPVSEAAMQDGEDEGLTIHDEPANDMPLDQKVREVLMRNAVPLEQTQREAPVFKLPPLLAAALAGEAEHPQAETEELHALRQELVVLRERLQRLADEERDSRRA